MFGFQQGNIFAGLEETFLARAEVLAAVDYSASKSQFKSEPNNHGFYTPGPSYVSQHQHPAPPIPPPGTRLFLIL